ncbi:hypothetical protein AGLY_004120 [Aphis glycines]|uniref:Uncharacterized protein n=1 Tax=Aphis glycines TaxID=307491 RepID=A0A6G0TXB7_APHGL|nr:hypothetical protein AGLY_004120 [Aphis glycines]
MTSKAKQFGPRHIYQWRNQDPPLGSYNNKFAQVLYDLIKLTYPGKQIHQARVIISLPAYWEFSQYPGRSVRRCLQISILKLVNRVYHVFKTLSKSSKLVQYTAVVSMALKKICLDTALPVYEVYILSQFQIHYIVTMVTIANIYNIYIKSIQTFKSPPFNPLKKIINNIQCNLYALNVNIS